MANMETTSKLHTFSLFNYVCLYLILLFVIANIIVLFAIGRNAIITIASHAELGYKIDNPTTVQRATDTLYIYREQKWSKGNILCKIHQATRWWKVISVDKMREKTTQLIAAQIRPFRHSMAGWHPNNKIEDVCECSNRIAYARDIHLITILSQN